MENLKDLHKALDAFLKTQTALEIENEKLEKIVNDLKECDIQQSAQMVQYVANQLQELAIEPIETHLKKIVANQKTAADNALNLIAPALSNLDKATQAINETTSKFTTKQAAILNQAKDELQNVCDLLNSKRIKIITFSAIFICALVSGIGIGSYLAFEYLQKLEDAKMQDLASKYASNNQVLDLLAKRGITPKIEIDGATTYFAINQKGEVYTSKNGSLVIKVLPK